MPEDDEVDVQHHHPGPDAVNPPPHRLTSGPISGLQDAKRGRGARTCPARTIWPYYRKTRHGETVAGNCPAKQFIY